MKLLSDHPTYVRSEFPDYVARKRQSLEEIPGHLRNVFVGSSHGDYGIVPSEIASSFNFCLTSFDIDLSVQAANLIPRIRPETERIFLTFSVFSPGFDLAKTRERNKKFYYERILGFRPTFTPTGLVSRSAMEARCGLTRVGVRRKSAISTSRQKGFLAWNPEARAKTHLRELNRLPTQLQNLSGLRNIRDQNDLEVFALIPPFSPEYSDLVKNEFQPSRILSPYFSEGQIFNFFLDGRFSREDFGDPDHLNDAGATKFSRAITQEITARFGGSA